MKQTLTAFCCILMAVLSGNAAGRSVVIDMRAAGDLESRLGDQLLTVETLTVSGPVNEADIKAMWKASYHGRLRELNLAAADIDGKKIPDYAFGFSNGNQAQCSPLLRSIVLPDDVTEIGVRAFFGLSFLESINMPKSLIFIGEQAFSGCGSLNVVDGFSQCRLATIDRGAFKECGNLCDVQFPETLKGIGAEAFASSGLQSVILPQGVEILGSGVFARCKSLRKALIPNGAVCYDEIFESNPLLEDLTMLSPSVSFYFARGNVSLRELKLPNAGYIGEDAFYGCRGLESIELGEGLTTLFDSAFKGCSKVKTLLLPSTLDSIGYNCLCMPGLESLYCKAAAPPEFNDFMPDWGGPFVDRPVANRMDAPRDIPVYVPVGTAELYRSAPGWNYFTNYVELAEFPTASELKSATALPPLPHAEVIMNKAGELASLLGENLLRVESLTVKGPVNQADFETMFDATFNGSLDDLDLSGADIEGHKIPDNAFGGRSQGLIACPTRLRRIVLPENIEEIGDAAFIYSLHLAEINIPKSVKRIGNRAFSQCSSLENLSLPDGLVEIGNNAFIGCSKLRSVVFPGSLQTIDYHAFASTAIEKVVIPDGVRKIGANAFASCPNLSEAVLPNSITDLSGSENLLADDIRLVSVQLPEGLKAIPNRFMSGCQSIENIDLPQSVESIGSLAFSACRSLERIFIPAKVTEISNEAFRTNFLVSQIVFPDSKMSIGSMAFRSLPNLERIYAKAADPAQCKFYIDYNNQPIGPFETYYGNPPSRDPSDDTPRDIPVYVPRGSKEAYQNAPGWNYFTNFIEVDEFPEAGIETIAAPNAAIEVRAEGGRIQLSGNELANADYAVYSVDGKLLATGRMDSQPITVDTGAGIFIVRCGDRCAKVAVR